MILHASISAKDPRHVANFLADLWGGEVFAFPPVPDAWIAMAGDARGSGIEVYPDTATLVPGDGFDMFSVGHVDIPAAHVATHLAIECQRPQADVEARAHAEGWRTVTCSRGGLFEVIEVWLENRTMIEVLTPEMSDDYRATSSIQSWRMAMAAVASGEVR